VQPVPLNSGKEKSKPIYVKFFIGGILYSTKGKCNIHFHIL